MPWFKRFIDYVTLGSDRPVRRLIAYYVVLAALLALIVYFFPAVAQLLLGGRLSGAVSDTSRLLQDGLTGGGAGMGIESSSLADLAITTSFALVGTILLMLPVSWVYMSARRTKEYSQSIVQTLVILPIVVAGIVFIVRNSLALAFGLAGVVAGVRFRTTLRDSRDVVYIFLGIAVGFSAGVQSLAVGALLSIIFNFILLLTWRYDFGRNVLMPTASSQWREPLNTLAKANGHSHVPDRDLVLTLTPTKVKALAERFDRVRDVLGPGKKRPRFNAVLSIAAEKVGETQVPVQKVLDKTTKRWVLDEVVTNTGKPSEIYYLVRMRKSQTRDELLTAIRARAGDLITSADLEVGESYEREREEAIS